MKNDKLIQTGKLVSLLASTTNPVIAIAGSFLFDSLAFHSTQKTNALILDLENRLEALEETGILEIEELKQDQSFFSFLLTACRIAQHTSRNEKIERIKNAVITHSINRFDDVKGSSILHLIDQLSEEHFIILTFIRDNINDLNKIKNYNEFYELFVSQNEFVSKDVFGHYFYDLKSRHLVRISAEISDNDGLKKVFDVLYNSEDGVLFVLSEVALELLKITSPKQIVNFTSNHTL